MNTFLHAALELEHHHSHSVIDAIFHSLEHAFKDTLITLPLLFLAYLLMEFLEHKASGKMETSLKRLGSVGPLIGAPLGCVPQCGFSATASNLYTAGLITEGTLISVFLATSDEAFVVLLSAPNAFWEILKLLLTKVIIGIFAGILLDIILKASHVRKINVEMCKDCGCEEDNGILKPAIKHTLKMLLFIFIINLVLGFAMEILGDEAISKILLNNSIFQPFITALVGLIPNCAVSAVITKLYIAGHLSFGSTIAGLCSSAGIGLAVLFKANPIKRENIRIILTLFVISVLSGMILTFI